MTIIAIMEPRGSRKGWLSTMKTIAKVNNSEFAMWRAVFAFSLADNVLSLEEQQLLSSYLRNTPFSPAQLDVIKRDLTKPQNVEKLYKQITEHKHRERFCMLARALAWCEGDVDAQEERILKHVACLSSDEHVGFLKNTRNDPLVARYARTGKMGILMGPQIMRMNA